MKIEFSSQRREMLLFLITNMAAVTSRGNQQFLVKYSHFSFDCSTTTWPEPLYQKFAREGN